MTYPYEKLSNPTGRLAFKNYLEKGEPPDDFYTELFANDLFGAYGAADDTNIRLVHEYVTWIWNYAPMTCHGSYDKVLLWIKNHPNNRGQKNESFE